MLKLRSLTRLQQTSRHNLALLVEADYRAIGWRELSRWNSEKLVHLLRSQKYEILEFHSARNGSTALYRQTQEIFQERSVNLWLKEVAKVEETCVECLNLVATLEA